MRTNPDAVQLLGEWIARCPQDFAGEYAQAAATWLLEHARMANAVARQFRDHQSRWSGLSEGLRRVASQRQIAAMVARLAMRNGMERSAAVVWVISLAGMTRLEFKRARNDVLLNGDQLFIWQWRELRAIGLRNDFMSRRQIECWLDLDEAWLFDERWVYPLHLVDAEALDGFVPGLSLVSDPEDHDAAE